MGFFCINLKVSYKGNEEIDTSSNKIEINTDEAVLKAF